jgi:hypothetical protein
MWDERRQGQEEKDQEGRLEAEAEANIFLLL